MTFSLFSIAILLIFFSVCATEVYRSIKKGFRMTLISLAIVVFSAIFASIFTYLISEGISSLIVNLFVNRLYAYRSMVQSYPWADALIEAVIGMIIGSFLYVAVFFVVRAVTRLIVGIVCAKKVERSADTPAYCTEKNSYFDQNEKLFSVITGVVISVIVTMVITSPIMGTLDVANKALGSVGKVKLKAVESISQYDVSEYSNDFFGNVFYQLGGKLMYYSSASAEIYGERVHLLSEADAVADIAEDLEVVYPALMNPKKATVEQVNRIYKLCDNIERLELCSGVLGEFVSNFAKAWQNGDKYFGIAKPTTNDLIDPAFDEILVVCRNTDHNSATANVATLLKIYATVMDSDLLNVNMNNFNSIISYVNKSDIVDRLDAILAENPHMSGISVSSIAMAAVSQYIRGFGYDVVKYDGLMEDIADAINNVNSRGYATDEEKAAVLASYAQKYIKEYGVTIPDNIASSVAEEILKNISSSSVTEEDVRRIFLKYAK